MGKRGMIIDIIMWISVATAISVGLYYTKSIWCLLFFILPTYLQEVNNVLSVTNREAICSEIIDENIDSEDVVIK